MKKIPIPIPPLEEQKRIVSKIEELFTQLDAGINELEQVEKRLDLYRDSFLKYAVSGKLTQEWRSMESNLENMRDKVKHEDTDSDELPKNWANVAYEDLGTWQGGNTPRRSRDDYWGGEIPWVSPKDMKTDRITSPQEFMTEKAYDETRSKIIPKDCLLMVTRSSILDHSLPIAISDVELTINQDLKAFTPNTDLLNPEYMLWVSKALDDEILRDCSKDGTTVASLNSKSLYNYKIPLPPKKEQEKITESVESGLTIIENIASNVSEDLKKGKRLRQSILKKAFRGELVPQKDQENKQIVNESEKSDESKNTVKQTRLN